MLNRCKTKINSKIEVGTVHGSPITGVRIGIDEDEVRKIIKEELKPALLQGDEIRELIMHDSIANSLFACESECASTIGFAINNSGTLICINNIGQITVARHLKTEIPYEVKYGQMYDMLQTLKIDKPTRGVVPSYKYYPQFDEKLYTFDNNGEIIELSVEAVDFQMKIKAGKIAEDGIVARLTYPEKFFGGPVINEEMEVMGIVTGKFENDGNWYFKDKAFPVPKGTRIVAFPYTKLIGV